MTDARERRAARETIGFRHRIAIVSLLAALAGCASSNIYDAYRSAHPAWDPDDFPAAGADLAETLAAVHVPPRDGTRTTLQGVRVIDVTDAQWTQVPLAALAPGGLVRTDPTRSRLVIARVACAMTTRNAWLANDATSWYLIVGERLMAHHRVTFDRACKGKASISSDDRLPAALRKCVRESVPKISAGLALAVENAECGAVSPRL